MSISNIQNATILDAGVIEAVRDGRAVLFLGAGASIGAIRGSNEQIPLSKELGRRIAGKFLGPGYDEADFKTICDFAASARSVRDLQAFIHEELVGYQPALFHLLIPTFTWAGIATTNYDLVIEGAYQKNQKRLQELIVNCRDGDGSAENLGNKGLLYVKLHGCITHYQEVNPPLIASTEQIINHRTGRSGQFSQFLEWAKTKTIIFAGYGMGDFNLRTLFEEIRKDGDNHSRHYIVRPGISKVEEDYWLERRVRAIDASFDSFLSALDTGIRAETRQLAQLKTVLTASSFTRFIAKIDVRESASLLRYLESGCEHVSTFAPISVPEAARFYKGFELGWDPLAHDLDVSRRIGRDILETNILATSKISKPQFVVLKGHAGGGKSVVLRRVAWDAAIKNDKLVFRVESGADLDKAAFDEIISLTNQTIFLVIDDVAEDAGKVADFLRHANRQRWPIVIIGGARVNEWNMRCEDLETLVDEVHELKYLSKSEIDDLLTLLELHGCLGHLAQLQYDKRREKLQEQYGRQLLVALHEATENATFRDIIADEYESITPPEAKLLYLDICSLHRFGPPVRAGLISRVHGIDFEEFNKRFFLPLEAVIDLSADRKTRDWTYKARHAVIAEIVYSVGLPTVKEKYDDFIRVISHLNTSYSYDREVLFELIRAQKLAEIFKERTMGAAIYEQACSSIGEDWGMLHQRGIYEMRLASDKSGLDRAELYLERALQLQQNATSVKHSLAELALRRSAVAKNDQEREAWRREAEKQAGTLASKSKNSYPLHTMAKIAVSRVKDYLERAEQTDTILSQDALNVAIKQAEEVLRLGLQTYPNDDRLLTEDAALSDLLKDADKALVALEKAFQTNPRSELIAKRLSRILRAKGRYENAIEVLRDAITHNQGSQQLHFDLAHALRESANDADTSLADSILYHFQRSFIKGDKQYEARFWFARQLTIHGRWLEAKTIFDELKKLALPYRQRTGLRGPVLNKDGTSKMFYGQITNNRIDFAFIRADQDGIECFTAIEHLKSDDQLPKEASRVKFAMQFSLIGPVAVEVERL
ncbi:SIR2 family protein [Rhizobium rhizogenes]|uniref:SIR2 family NAD-dependent protein deacylase n=1 Tax=Rhizobium rhizogenes TaxID=359 RepID=UPI001574E487|nr:SIR2 family protein [Rhizobium rhizogenes]NTF43386.1 tetratricopeptide repeat protein [Rhizobium rhizogenes]